MSSILVIGSSGNVGRALTAELVRAGEQVRAATRNPSQMQPAAGIEPVRFDYADKTTFAPALKGTNRVFLLGPPTPTAHEVMVPFVEAAARDGRKVVLMTAMGAESDEGGSLRQVETTLEHTGAPFVILRPNWFMDNFHTAWLDPIQQQGVIPLPAGDSRTSLIDARDIGAAAAAALRTERFNGQAFTLTGPEAVTYKQAAATLSKAAGREINYVAMDDEPFIQSLIDAGVPANLATYLDMLFGLARQGAAAPVSPAVEELTGKAPRTLEQYAKDHASAWRGTSAAAKSV